MLSYHNLIQADPFRLKKKTPKYKNAYGICMTIPALLAFSFVFFLIFYMSPRGMNMRKYQKQIFQWNLRHIPEHMQALQFQMAV